MLKPSLRAEGDVVSVCTDQTGQTRRRVHGAARRAQLRVRICGSDQRVRHGASHSFPLSFKRRKCALFLPRGCRATSKGLATSDLFLVLHWQLVVERIARAVEVWDEDTGEMVLKEALGGGADMEDVLVAALGWCGIPSNDNKSLSLPLTIHL